MKNDLTLFNPGFTQNNNNSVMNITDPDKSKLNLYLEQDRKETEIS